MSHGSVSEPGAPPSPSGSAELGGGLPDWFLVEDAAEAQQADARARIVVRRVSASRPLMAVIVVGVLAGAGVGAWLVASLARFEVRQAEILLKIDRLDARLSTVLEVRRQVGGAVSPDAEQRPVLESRPR